MITIKSEYSTGLLGIRDELEDEVNKLIKSDEQWRPHGGVSLTVTPLGSFVISQAMVSDLAK